MMLNLLGFSIAAIALLALLTGLTIMAKWKPESEQQFRILLGSLLGILMYLTILLFILRR